MYDDTLSSTSKFVCYRFREDRFVPLGDNGFDRFFLFWRSCEDGYLFETRESEIEGTRDGSSRERENVESGSEFFEFFLVTHSELVFLIDHEESESCEADIIREESMSSHNDIDVPIFQVCKGFFLFFFATHSSQYSDTNPEGSQSLIEGLIVFICQDEKRRDEGYLGS